jgi:hypothetical protein
MLICFIFIRVVQRKKRMHTAHAEKARAQEGEEATESDDEKTLLDDSDEEFDDSQFSLLLCCVLLVLAVLNLSCCVPAFSVK